MDAPSQTLLMLLGTCYLAGCLALVLPLVVEYYGLQATPGGADRRVKPYWLIGMICASFAAGLAALGVATIQLDDISIPGFLLGFLGSGCLIAQLIRQRSSWVSPQHDPPAADDRLLPWLFFVANHLILVSVIVCIGMLFSAMALSYVMIVLYLVVSISGNFLVWCTGLPHQARITANLGRLRVGGASALAMLSEAEYWSRELHAHEAVAWQNYAELLRRGAPPEVALTIPGLVPSDGEVVLRAAALRGRLEEGLDELNVSAQRRLVRLLQEQRSVQSILYLGLVPLVVMSLLSFMSYVIVPKIRRISQDFEITFPPISETVFTWSPSVQMAVLLTGVLAQLVVIWLGLMIVSRQTSWVRIRRLLFEPWTGWFSRTDLLGNLGRTLRYRLPLPDSLELMCHHGYSGVVRRRLTQVREDVAEGHDAWASLAARGLISTVQQEAIAAGSRQGQTSWVLIQLAAVADRRQRALLDNAVAMLTPVVTLLLAVVVAAVGYACLTPAARWAEAIFTWQNTRF